MVLFTWSTDDEPPWWKAKPDLERYYQLEAERRERVPYDDEPPRRRKDDSNVNPLVSYLLKAGVTAGIAVGLTYWLTIKLDAQLEENARLQRDSIQMQQAHAAMTTMMAEQATRTERLMGQLVALEFVSCGRSAKTLTEVRQCDRAASK